MFVTPFTRTASALVRSMSSSTSGVGRLSGKIAVVTASTDGIGYAIAKKLGEEGAHVVVSSRKLANVERAVKDLKAANLQVNMGLLGSKLYCIYVWVHNIRGEGV